MKMITLKVIDEKLVAIAKSIKSISPLINNETYDKGITALENIFKRSDIK